VDDIFYVTGLAWSPVYLLATREPVLFEAGFHCAGRLYEEGIKSVLGDKSPETLFLTHVHWDHCGATTYLKRVFPGIRVAASRRSADIVRRPNAQALMRKLSQDVIHLVERINGVDRDKLIREPFEPFETDIVLEDGQILDIGSGLTVQTLATPGHTRDMFSYYIPEKRILIATEAAGVLDQANHVITEFLVDYDLYMTSLKRLAALDVNILCQGHHFVFGGEDVRKFFDRSVAAAEEFQKDVERLLRNEGGSVERVVRIIKARQYDTNKGVKQSEKAYLLNLTARISHLAERMQGKG
jgi:2-aminobenzoylacetyl-CoA thioesterase